MKNPIVQFRIPQDTLTKIQQLSAGSGFSVSEIVRACIDRAYPYVEDKVKTAVSLPVVSN